MEQKKLYKEIEWLKKQKDYISIYKIEQDLGMSEGTLKKFVNNERGLAAKWHDPVMNWVKSFKK